MRKSLLHRNAPLKRSPIKRRVSIRMKEEKARRMAVYAYLWEHCPTRDGVRICVHCGRNLDWHWKGHEMHHLVKLSQGGKTDTLNCQLWCFVCHRNEGHGDRVVT